jgi:hypothetical protein
LEQPLRSRRGLQSFAEPPYGRLAL